jgi:amino acid adenylation domain-containing protein
VERSVDMMIGIMGIVRADGAYMPIDPEYPDDRVSYMLEDSSTRVILTEARFRDRLGALAGEGITIVALDEQWPALRREAAERLERGETLRHAAGPENVAYVIYTSGSTGKPKGVLVEHRALVNRIHWMQKSYGLSSADVVVQKTPYCFDVSVWEFFWPPMTGASLVFAVANGHSDVQYLEGLINSAGVTTLHYVPSMLHAFLDNAKGQCPGVRLIFCSGEALDRTSVDRYRAVFPNAELHNLYGPTEAAIDVTFYDCTRISYPFVPIGAPIDNTQIHIVDEANNPQPVGVPGELHIAGVNLARGYLNRAELTQDRFIANPFDPGTRMYKTGDLARWLDDGNIQYLGRIDAQVKIGGVRIETGEIEAHLNRHEAISESVVIARGPDGYKQLIAFYRTHESTRDDVVKLAHKDLRDHLVKTLPEYMIPAAFVSVASIPVTSNGKADRKALERIDVGLESSQEYLAPRSDAERALVEIWAQVFKEKGFVLEQAKIGVNDNFFELGGNSLLAVQIAAEIEARWAVRVSPREFYINPTVAELAAIIEEARP